MILYYLHKLIQTSGSLKLAIVHPRAKWKNWIIRYTPKNFEFQNHVILGFWDTKLMHLGDQLFHIGLIRSLQAAGIKVTICGDTPLRSFFKRMNVYFMDKSELKDVNGALVLSKDDIFFGSIRRSRKNAFLGVNYRFTKSKERIGEIIFEETKKSLESFGINLEMKKEFWNIDSLIPSPDKKFDLPTNTILYHDFVVSGALSAYQRLPIIFNIGTRLAKRGHKLVYIGSKKQKRQRVAPGFVGIDMRGESGILDLFPLVSHENVEAVLTYDTLLVHVANLMNKKGFVVNKQERNQDKIWNRFVPMSKYVSSEVETY